jgi:phosphatidylinositol glycan class B
VSSADQHFQIVEFSLFQLGKPNGAVTVWEIEHFVRPTLQVYLFSGFYLVCNVLSITDPYVQLTILRVILGVSMFAVFNLIALYYFRNDRKILFYVLLLLNFSWVLPYTRTLYCSEIVSSMFFFGTLLLYERYKDRSPGLLTLLATGLLFSLAFYFRFQIAFALMGFGIWLIFFQKKFRHIIPIAAGFIAGVFVNGLLDYKFYHEWVFTPYEYFAANIFEGRASSFGTSSFLRYIGLILLVAPAPPFSIFLFYYSVKAFFRKYRNPLFLSAMLFIVFHSLIGHKEERFLFPVFNVLPIIIGWAIPELENFYRNAVQWVRYIIKGALVLTLCLNFILLALITFIPYSQTIHFSDQVRKTLGNDPVTLYCIGQTPFETPSGNKMVFYKNGAKNITLQRVASIDSISGLKGKDIYLAASFKEIKDKKGFLDQQGYKPVKFSSPLIWKINEFLQAKNVVTINEIWVLYKKE